MNNCSGIFRQALTRVVIVATFLGVFCAPAAEAAGVTIIVHGFTPGLRPLEDVPSWVDSMRSAINEGWIEQSNIGSGANYGEILVNQTSFGSSGLKAYVVTWPTAAAFTGDKDIVININWASISDQVQIINVTNVAEKIVPLIINAVNDLPPLAELPIHLIGHSRGGVLVCELARMLGERGVWIDQVTTLDPHKVGVSVLGFDPEPRIYENVLFADNYYQNGGTGYVDLDFNGQQIEGSYNRHLDNSKLGKHRVNLDGSGGWDPGYAIEHSDVHLWYFGTIAIDLTDSVFDGSVYFTNRIRKEWYEPLENSGASTGFRFSRIAERKYGEIRTSNAVLNDGGTAISTGLRLEVGGTGSTHRDPITDKSNATWPNLVTVDISQNGNIWPAGPHHINREDALDIAFGYASYKSNWDAEFFLDNDRNPYNGHVGSLANFSGGTSDFVSKLTVPFKLKDGVDDGIPYYVYGKITGGGHTRYLYALPSIIFSPDNTNPTVVNHSVGSDPATNITFFFSEAMDKSTFTSDNIEITDASSAKHTFATSYDPNTFTLTIDPDVGFTAGEDVEVSLSSGIQDLEGLGLTGGNGSFTFTVAEAQFFVSAFSGPHGTVNPSGLKWFTQGSDVTFTATPDSGYIVDRWNVDLASSDNTSNSYTITSIQNNHSLDVTFKLAPLPSSITVTAPNAGDTLLAGRRAYITWKPTTSPTCSNVKVDLYKGGVFNTPLTPSVPLFTGAYKWNIPSDILEANSYSVKVTCLEDASVSDMSDAFTVIPSAPRRDTIRIYTVADLKNVSTGGLYPTQNVVYLLMNDIKLSTSDNFKPLGQSGPNAFGGTFDGQGHLIYRLNIDRPTENSVGLFSTLKSNGTIKNLNLEIWEINGNQFVGGLVGFCLGKVINCHITRIRTWVSGASSVGGLIGETAGNSALISECSVVLGNGSDLRGTSRYVGGLVGYNNAGRIEYSYFVGEVNSPTADEIGGLVGGNYNSGEILECYSSGVNCDGNESVGGIVGLLDRGTVRNCYTTMPFVRARWSGTGGAIVGQTGGQGIIISSYASTKLRGQNNGALVGRHAGQLIDCRWNTDVAGVSNTVGSGSGAVTRTFGITGEEMTHKANFANWDFDNTWSINEGVSWPVLRAIVAPLVSPTGLTATTDQSDGVHLSWSDQTYPTSDGMTYNAFYSVFRAIDADLKHATMLDTLWSLGNTFVDTNTIPNVAYYYWVSAAATPAGARQSALSAMVSGSSVEPPLDAPTGVVASSGKPSAVLVSWDAVDGAGAYHLYHSNSSGGAKTPIGNWQSGLSESDIPPQADSVYYYWVKAARDNTGDGESQFSAFATGYYIFIDTVAPTLTITHSIGTPIETQSDTITIVADDNEALDSLVLYWNNGADHQQLWNSINVQSDTVSYILGPLIADSTITFWATAWDTTGNSTTSGQIGYVVQREKVSTPVQPIGRDSINAGDAVQYYVHPSSTNLNGSVEYKFIFGDSTLTNTDGTNTSMWSADTLLTVSHWSIVGTASLAVIARSVRDTTRVSPTSIGRTILVTDIQTGVGDDEHVSLPKEFTLKQNYPNPFNPTTNISYSLPVRSNVVITIYNILGQRVKEFDIGTRSAGTYEVTWNSDNQSGKPVASGMYFYRMKAGEFIRTRKMVLLK